MLATKSEVGQLASPKVPPKHSLSVGRVLAKGAGETKHSPENPAKRASLWQNTTCESIRLLTPPSPCDGDTSPLRGEGEPCPPCAKRGVVSAQRTEGSWGISSVEVAIHFTPRLLTPPSPCDGDTPRFWPQSSQNADPAKLGRRA